MKYCFYLLLLFFCYSPLVLANKSELIIAVYIEPPFTDFVNDEYVGEHIDTVKILAKSLNFTPVFVRCPFARCLTMVQQGNADIIIGVKKLAEREKDLIFLNPPYMVQHDPLRFFTLSSKNTTINNFDDLSKLTVGTLRGAKYFELFDQNETMIKVELTTREQLINMLLHGRIDTFIAREESILSLMNVDEYKEKFSLANYQYDTAVNSYVAISKHSDINIYTQELSNQLKMLVENGTVDCLRIKYRN